MPQDLIHQVGFDNRNSAPERSPERTRPLALAELIATVALTVSTVITAVVVSIGIARAAEPGVSVVSDGNGDVAIALFIGLVLVGMGGLTALMARERLPHS